MALFQTIYRYVPMYFPTLILMLLSSVFYWTLSWYLEKVFPGNNFAIYFYKLSDQWMRIRHERDQSFLVPVPVRKKISSRSRSRRKKVLVLGPGLGPGPGGKKF